MGSLAGKLSSVAVVLLLALGLVACGGDDDSDSDSTGTTTAREQQDGSTAGAGSGQGQKAKQDGKSGQEQQGGGSGGEDSSSGGDGRDSGGGAEQFRVKGGDNSIQEYGEEASEPEFDEAALAVHGFLDARVRGDWEAACSHLSADVVESLRQLAAGDERLANAGCATLFRKISEGAPQTAFKAAAQADVGSLRVEGDRAFVLYHGAGGLDYAMPMVSEDGEWKVASLAGTPIS